MANQPPAQDHTHYFTEGLWITASTDDRSPLTPLKGSGGGGPGYGGWGLSEGRPRGTGISRSNAGQELALRRVFGEEQQGAEKHYAQQYAPLLTALPLQIQEERAALEQQAAAPGGSPSEIFARRQQLTTAQLQQKRIRYLETLPSAIGFYGAVPFYKRNDSLMTRINDRDAFPLTGNTEAWINNIWVTYEASLDASYKLHMESEKIRVLADTLPEIARQFDEAELTQPDINLPEITERRTKQIQTERKICFECLPNFLQHQFVQMLSPDQSQTLSEQLATEMNASQALEQTTQLQIPTYTSANPAITGALSKPQLEALQHLVDEQANRRAGPLWAPYHRALALKESIRYLQRFTGALNNLHQRAIEVERLQSVHQADLVAAEAARQQSETERNRSRYSVSTTVASAMPVVLPVGAASFAIAQASYEALQVTIRTAITARIAALSPVSLPALVGTVAMLWPSTLGNAERRYLTSIPLADLSPPDGPDLAAMAASAQALDLPYLLAGVEEEERLDIYVVPGGKPVPVHAATFDSERKVYTLALETSKRTLTWTPASAPGSESTGPTTSPAELPGTVVYAGSTLTPIDTPQESYPSLDLLDQDRLIVTFPSDSGLPPILVMFRDPRAESGTRSGSGGSVTGLWLDDKARQLGTPIPSQIASQLSGTPVNDMKEFREDLWKLVARDSALSTQFSESNIKRMKSGLAPKVPIRDRHKSQSTFILHHHVPISEGGSVYDFDNIRIVTPKAHFNIHYGEKP